MSIDLAAAFGRQEDLLDELVFHLEEIEGLGQVLRHPLYYSIPHGPALNAVANLVYTHKLKLLREARARRDVSAIIHLYERPYRVSAFMKYAHLLENDAAYWQHLRGVWIQTEVFHTHLDDWLDLLASPRAGRENMMDEEERAHLASLPETVTIYRGGHHGATIAEGLSWTHDPSEAEWFARRYEEWPDRIPHVCTARIRRDDIIANFATGEAEVVALPASLHDIRVEALRPK